ncbi:MAG TPA: YkvA family protein [Gemmataceae bacterium]|nr:YkvA family protein [Gemmataceae bacterium]
MGTLIQTFMICGTLLVLAFLVLLSMPKSQLRFFLLEILGWTGAALAGLYVLCPIDVIPDFIPVAGWLDDGGALIGGIAAFIAAISARSDRQRWLAEQPRQDATRALAHSKEDSEEQNR